MAALFWCQLKAMLWRNILLKKRNKMQLLQELFFPVFFVTIMAITKALTKPKTFQAIPSFPENPLSNDSFHLNASRNLLVSPNTTKVNSLMSEISSLLGVQYEMFDNQSAVEERYKTDSSDVAAGLIFNFTGTNLSYTIRLPYESLPFVDMFTARQNQGDCRGISGTASGKSCKANQYLTSGFVWLQNAVDTALIRQFYSSFQMPTVSVQLMPKDEFTPSILGLQIASSIYFVVSYSFFINFLCVNLVAEKEKKIREGMKIMGLRDSVWWLSWVIVYTLIILIVTITIIIIAIASSYFGNSNVFILFIILFLYGLSIINMAFFMTPFFKNAQIAGIVAGFSTVIISVLYFSVTMTRTPTNNGFDYAIPPAGRWALCLLSPVALALAMDQAVFLDVAKGGMTFSTIKLGDFPLYAPIVMLTIDIFLYITFAIYLDHIIPGEYGPRYKPWFCFMSSYWFGNKNRTDSNMLEDDIHKHQDRQQTRMDNMEPVSEDLADKAGIRILNISKEFKGQDIPVRAVNQLSLEMYEGQITALLGHNGAGKTTLINMLCGLSPPSSGTAFIKDMDVSQSGDMERIRAMTGVCPQHNILYDQLSCREHLYVFAGIKGVPDKDKSKLVNQAMKDADIADQADVFAKDLSGGQKRKLSVAIALIGDPKILFLDEPSAGMDPYSRRHLWSLLKNSKEGKIILLTTHFMDEADILADRKAIISHGKLKCCGSSLFLKNRYGIGYHLHMVVEPDCDADKVTDVLKKHVSGVEMKRSHAKELAFIMPIAEVTKFPKLFSHLESPVSAGKTQAESLGIKSFGVSMTSLEEVFLKIGEEEEASGCENLGYDPTEDNNADLHTNSDGEVNVAVEPDLQNGPRGLASLETSVNIKRQRFLALLKIRFLFKIRNKVALVFQIIIPIILVVIGCILSKQGKTAVNSSPKPLTIKPFYIVQSETPLLAVDTADTTLSNQFINGLKSKFDVDKINSSVKIADLSKHWMGFNLIDLQTNYSSTYTAMYNDSAIHSLPAVINLMSNRFLAFVENKTDISVSSLVWPSMEQKNLSYDTMVFTAGLILAMAFVLVTPGFAVEIVKDRQLNARSQLRVSGITFNMYWTTSFLFHLSLYFIPATICIIIVIAAQVPSLSTGGAIFSLVLVFITYSPANLLLSYVFSFAFTKYESCQAVMPNVFIYIALLPYILISLLDMLGHSSVAEKLHYAFTVVDPPYIIFGGVYYISRVSRVAEILKQSVTWDMYFKWSSNVLISIIVSLVHFGLLYFLLRVLDIHSTRGTPSQSIKVDDIPQENNDIEKDEDEDVAEERLRVASFQTAKDKIPVSYVENLRKEFKKRGKISGECCKQKNKEDKVKVVVRNATFGVNPGEVLGLLGPNGAGKTTTLNMIIAETEPTRGKVIVDGYNINSSMSEAFQALGYCPQHDALWDTITLREHLECYAAIKGIPKRNIQSVVNYYIDSLKLHDHVNKRAVKLSGGTRRKVSYVMSMLGNPKIVLLDEPSTGMDPQSKRFLWDTMSSSFQSTGQGAILTTHYMEEADALCSRVAIMINGQIKCLGPTQHLKDKFGSGYLLEIKLHISGGNIEDQMDQLESHIASLFPHVEVLERFGERGQYKISKSDVTFLSKSFSALEEMKSSHNVEEYSFSQTTLEQVFLEFAKMQHEEGMDPLDEKSTHKELGNWLSKESNDESFDTPL